jgi:hypothetical protein
MDYPQFNFLFGLGLILANVVSLGLRVLLSRAHLPAWISRVSWLALSLSLLSAVYIGYLFLRFMPPVFNQQIGVALLILGSVSALVTAGLYRLEIAARVARLLVGMQILTSLAGVGIAFILYRSLVPISAGVR